MDDVFFPNNGLLVDNSAFASYPYWSYFTVYQGLVAANVTSQFKQSIYQYLPALASNWTVSANGTVYTFNLRQNVAYSNGDPFNAYQVWTDMYNYYLTAGNSSTWWGGYPLFDMSHVIYGPATLSLINSSGLANPSTQVLSIMKNSSWPIFVTGPNQIVFHQLGDNTVLLPSLSTGTPFMELPDAQWILANGGPGSATSPNQFLTTNAAPGTGPYVISGYQINAYVKYTQNPNYWGRSLSAAQIASNPLLDPGHYQTVFIYYKSDDVSRYIELSQGTVQIGTVGLSTWNQVTANPSLSIVLAPPAANTVGPIALNTKQYPTNITAVRQAIVHAINYQNLINKTYNGYATATVPPEFNSYPSFYDLGNYAPYQYNMSLAKKDLAGIDLSKFPTLNIGTRADCLACITASEAIQSDLQAIGISSTIQVWTVPQFFTLYGSYSYNLSHNTTIPQISVAINPTWQPFVNVPADPWISFTSNGSFFGNYAMYSTPNTQACISSFLVTTNTSQIQSVCSKAQADVYNDAPYIFFTNRLWDGAAGTIAWRKDLISSFSLDPAWGTVTLLPVFNTVVPASK
ncbi:MAG: ABC transporter substrate-binding protein [Thaumarchaeota archaeon]|nr:ABC transporter substrate-binding protein [Nitrososphaerota archaeon]